jgi:DNA-binding GntR family transcriptional regulator
MVCHPPAEEGKAMSRGRLPIGNGLAFPAAPPHVAAATLAETIRTGLSEEIIAGRLSPGAEIDEQAVAERFGASRTPVREALRELAAAGLVSIEPRRGVRVAALTLERLGEMFEVMAETEAVCTRLATHRMTALERLGLLGLHGRMEAAAAAGSIDRYDALNREFHTALYRATHNAYLAENAQALRLRLAPFRRAQFHGADRLRRSHAEHAGVLQQVLRGDGEEAARLMRAHMLAASATLAACLGEQPGASAP